MDISFKLGSKQNSNLKMQLNQYNNILNNQKNMILALNQQNALRQQQQVVAPAPVAAPVAAPVVAPVAAPVAAPVVAPVVAASMHSQPNDVKKLPKKGFNVLF